MKTDNNIASLSVVNGIVNKIIEYLNSDDRSNAAPLLNISPHLWKLDLKNENESDKSKFRRLAKNVFEIKDKLPEKDESTEFIRNVTTLYKTLGEQR